MREIVLQAFLATRNEFSADVVIADPKLNSEFLRACRAAGLAHLPSALNLCLLNLRKSPALEGIKSRRISVTNQEELRFASEVAIRFLQRRYQLSLDRILCDPDRALQFDTVAGQIAPGFSPFQDRWAALNVRKRRQLRPELLGKVVGVRSVTACPVSKLKLDKIPPQPGLYLFMQSTSVLYIGECRNLRKRISKHLDHSDNKGLAHWLWQNGVTDLHLEYHVLPEGVSTRVRKALEAELIMSRHPVFNVAGISPQE